jgi:TolB-like protein/Tfp pilus assembly protein PilF
MPSCDPSAQAIRQAVDRIAGSVTFGRSEGAKRFLRYVVEKSLTEQSAAIKEYAIALEVFQRATYDPKVDSLVRVEASKLRGLLRKYYEGEGAAEGLRIEIPKGSYVPRFTSAPAVLDSPRQAAVSHAEPPSERAVPPAVSVEGRAPRLVEPAGAPRALPAGLRRGWALGVFGIVLVLVVTGLVGWAMRRPADSGAPARRTTPQPSLAILPFDDVSTDGAFAYVAAGLTEEITIAVARFGSVRMPSRTSVRRYSTGDTDPRQVGRDLGVNAVLEGTSRVEGQWLTVAVALVDTRDGLRLWSEVYQRPLDDLVEVQRSISGGIARELSLLNTTQRALVRPHSNNPEAYQHYLRATFLANGSGDLSPAIELFRAATVADPAYALAWASLSSTLAQRAHWGFGRVADVATEAEAAARRALTLDPTLAEAHQAEGRVAALLRFDLETAERAMRRAIELDPAAIELREDYAALVLAPQGRLDEARQQLERCLGIDPQDMTTQLHLAHVLLRQGDLDAAEAWLREVHAYASASPVVQVRLGTILVLRDRPQQALEHFESAAANIRSSWVLGYLGWGLARAGRAGDARAVLAEMRRGTFADKKVGMAAIHAALAESDAALTLLEEAATEQSSELQGVSLDMRFRELRSLPRFHRLVEQVDGRTRLAASR